MWEGGRGGKGVSRTSRSIDCEKNNESMDKSWSVCQQTTKKATRALGICFVCVLVMCAGPQTTRERRRKERGTGRRPLAAERGGPSCARSSRGLCVIGLRTPNESTDPAIHSQLTHATTAAAQQRSARALLAAALLRLLLCWLMGGYEQRKKERKGRRQHLGREGRALTCLWPQLLLDRTGS